MQALKAALIASAPLKLMFAAGLVVFAAMPAAAQSGTRFGLLICKMGPTIGLIVGSHQSILCTYTPITATGGRGYPEDYSGSITRVGPDVGFRADGVIGWAVFATTPGISHSALTGNYVKASGDASLGVLVGGSHKTISLQPLVLPAQAGVNSVAGLALQRIHH